MVKRRENNDIRNKNTIFANEIWQTRIITNWKKGIKHS